jgi:hypothetical protein
LQDGLLQSTTFQAWRLARRSVERIGGVENLKPFDQRSMRVGFAARFDQEKQPDFYMDLIEMYLAQGRHRKTLSLLCSRVDHCVATMCVISCEPES